MSFEVTLRDGVTRWEPTDGFYKSVGFSAFFDEGDKVILTGRYDERIVIDSPEEVILSSLYWHEYSNDRFQGWRDTPPHWAALYETLKP